MAIELRGESYIDTKKDSDKQPQDNQTGTHTKPELCKKNVYNVDLSTNPRLAVESNTVIINEQKTKKLNLKVSHINALSVTQQRLQL